MAIWLLVFGVGTILARAGLTVWAIGTARPRDVADALLRAGLETAAAALAFWAVGAPLLFGRQSVYLGLDPDLILTQPASAGLSASEAFHAAVAVVGGAVVAGAVAGRARLRLTVVTSAVLGGVVFPVVGHVMWFGRLRLMNVIDFGGATAVHLSAAVFAAVAAAAVGSRPDRNGNSNAGLIAAAAGLLAVGWLPYLMGCVVSHPTDFNPLNEGMLAQAAMNGGLAAAGGLLGGTFYGRTRRGRADLATAAVGMLGGLVSITAGTFAVGNLGALMIGLVAGLLVPAAADGIGRAGLDDPAAGVAVHGVGAVWGMMAAALFAANQTTMRRFQLLAVQSLATAVTLVVAAVAAAATVGLLRATGTLRDHGDGRTGG